MMMMMMMKNDDNTWLVHSSHPTWHSCLHGESQEGGLPEIFYLFSKTEITSDVVILLLKSLHFSFTLL